MASSLDAAVVLPAIANAARELMEADMVAFWLADEATQTLALTPVVNDDPIGDDDPARTLAFDQCGAGWVATHRQLLHVPDVFADARIQRLDWWRAHKPA